MLPPGGDTGLVVLFWALAVAVVVCLSIRPAEHGSWPVFRCCHTKERKNLRRCGEPGKPAFSGQGCLRAQRRNAFANGKSLLVHDFEKKNGQAMPARTQHFAMPEHWWAFSMAAHGSTPRAGAPLRLLLCKDNDLLYLLLRVFATAQEGIAVRAMSSSGRYCRCGGKCAIKNNPRH